MATYGRYGILYGYFLKVCKSYVYQKVHEELKVPKDVGEMYRYLVEEIYYHYECAIEDVFPWYLKHCVSNKDTFGEYLDVTMYFNIMKIFKINVPQYLVDQRNYFCHIPLPSLQRGMNPCTFERKLRIMKRDLGEAGIDGNLLTEVEEQIKTLIT